MDYFLLILLIIVIIALVVVLVNKPRRKDNLICTKNGIIEIPLTLLSSTTTIDEKNLSEITDDAVIARISDTIPNAAQAVAKTVTDKATKNTELFKLDIPSSALVKSKEVKGAFRAFSRGKNEISKNANLVKVDPAKISKVSAVTNSAVNIINVVSLVVGQYYMAEINIKLETMGKNINEISDFQDREFKSRILSLIARVGVISKFSSEILENDEHRKMRLLELSDLNGSATELLGQVNETIIGISQNNPNPKYEEYQEKVDDFYLLVEYQNVLVAVLEENSKLTYLLGKGGISIEMSYTLYKKYLELSVQARTVLEVWHDRQVMLLKIDLDKNRKIKSGVEGFFSVIPAVIDDKWKYKELRHGLADKINTQAQSNLKLLHNPKAVYEDDVQIIIKNGKYYYLTGEMYDK